jgi:hypothetical protein
MCFLEHLAQLAGADLSMELFLFLIFVRVMFFRFGRLRMAGSVELFSFDDFLFYQPRPGRKSGHRLDCRGLGFCPDRFGRRRRRFVRLLFSPE